MNNKVISGSLASLMFFFMLFSGGQQANAQGMHVTASNLALGGGGSAYMTGYHANFVNPANLMLPDNNRRLTIGILGGLSTGAGGGLVNISMYNRHFTNGDLITATDAMSIADDWFGSGSDAMQNIGFSVGVVPLGASYRREDLNMAFSSAVRVRAMNTSGMSRGFFELALTGLNSQVFAEQRSVSLNTEFLTFAEWSFGFAMEVWRNQDEFTPGSQRVYAGAAPKILFGMDYAKISFASGLQVIGGDDPMVLHDFDYYIETTGSLTEELDDYYQDRRVLGDDDAQLGEYLNDDSFFSGGSFHGYGFALDLGGTWEWYMRDVSIPVIGSGPQILRASLSITDVGGINFRDNAGRFRAEDTFLWEGASVNFDLIDAEYDGKLSNYFEYVLEDSIGNDIYANFSPDDVSSHRVGLTPMINVGGALTMGRLDVMMDIGKGMNSRGVNSNRLYTALGTEYRLLNVIPLRMGMRLGGYSAMNLSFGTGINLPGFEFSVGMMTTPNSNRGGANIAAAWSGFVMRF
ncbi:DUF5723 family protein [Balneolales bacterium ANBcel1]|nr:DUF5723 family protein [Balneolales bacterium ANBcel1]